jgi:hypothetical protein
MGDVLVCAKDGYIFIGYIAEDNGKLEWRDQGWEHEYNLDEAIKHNEEVADSYNNTVPDCDCAKEHRQLAEWLKELKHLRNLVAYSIDFHCTIEKAEKKLRVAEDKIAYIESLNKGEV